jgi:hypothetical protein
MKLSNELFEAAHEIQTRNPVNGEFHKAPLIRYLRDQCFSMQGHAGASRTEFGTATR